MADRPSSRSRTDPIQHDIELTPTGHNAAAPGTTTMTTAATDYASTTPRETPAVISSSSSPSSSPGKITPDISEPAIANATTDSNHLDKPAASHAAVDLTDPNPVSANNFAFTPTQLHKIQSDRTLDVLEAFGGIRGLAIGLRTDPVAGLNADEGTLDGGVSLDEAVAAGREDRTPIRRELSALPEAGHHGLRILERDDDKAFTDRIRVFGRNKLPKRRQKSFLRLMWIAWNDKLIILLTISATISLVIGIYQSLDAGEGGSNIEWVDGVTVVVAILVIVFASAATDWQKNRKFAKLNERKEQRDVLVIRSGCDRQISVYDVVVGDVMHLEAGDVVAVDGVLIQGSNLQVDESSLSGESELVHKIPADRLEHHRDLEADPFILSGTTVARGVGRYLVTAVGPNSSYGRVLMSLRSDVEETPLQAKLGRFGKQLITFGAIAGTIFFFILLIRWLVNIEELSDSTPSEKAEQFFEILILAVTVVVITVPEGLALNVTIALAFATKRMLKDNNLVRLIRSCEIMGNATTICSDKTGTLTQNKMTVVAGRIGLESYFDDIDVPEDDRNRPFANPLSSKAHTSGKLVADLSQEVRDLIRTSISLNSTAFESDDTHEFVGMSTETALLKFARDHLGMSKLREERANNPVVTMLPFDSSRKWMGALVKLPNGKYRLFIKGAAEIVFEYCAYAISDPTYKLQTDHLTEEIRADYQSSIHEYAKKMLRPVVLGYKDFEAAEVFTDPDDEPDSVNLEWLASGMILIGVFGIRDPLRPEVMESVRVCQNAGVMTRMVTGDNYETAKAIASECGIFTPGGVVMDGRTFRKLSNEQLDAIIPRLQVLARSSPEDKLLLVTHLKKMGETVAVTGDGTNDALALKSADVGFAMGVQGTEVAKEAASIILLDDNFSSIVSALSWGRTVNDAVRKFIQVSLPMRTKASHPRFRSFHLCSKTNLASFNSPSTSSPELSQSSPSSLAAPSSPSCSSSGSTSFKTSSLLSVSRLTSHRKISCSGMTRHWDPPARHPAFRMSS